MPGRKRCFISQINGDGIAHRSHRPGDRFWGAWIGLVEQAHIATGFGRNRLAGKYSRKDRPNLADTGIHQLAVGRVDRMGAHLLGGQRLNLAVAE